jgi:hypothetical protein
VTLVDPVAVTVQALTAKGYNVHPTTEAESANIDRSALTSANYVWVEEVQGSTPHIRYSDRPTVQVIVYSNLGIMEATRLARKISKDLQDSQGVKFAAGGIHRVLTLIRPARQDLVNLPPGVGRAVAQYELILSTFEKWS